MERKRLVYLDCVEGDDVPHLLLDDGYRIMVQKVKIDRETGDTVNDGESYLWAQYKACDDPCVSAGIASLLMMEV